MNSKFVSPVSEKIWQKMKMDAKNNIKTPLGLVSLMINIEHFDEYTKQASNDSNEFSL